MHPLDGFHVPPRGGTLLVAHKCRDDALERELLAALAPALVRGGSQACRALRRVLESWALFFRSQELVDPHCDKFFGFNLNRRSPEGE